MGLSGGKTGDIAFRMYSVAGVVMGLILGLVSVYTDGLQGLAGLPSFLATLGLSTLLFVALIPVLRARTGPVVVRGETARGLMIGVLSYYPLVYVVWSSVYQTYLLLAD